MRDVRGYEEQDSQVLAALDSGYPRFVLHAFVRELIAYYCKREGLFSRDCMLIAGRRAADDALAYLDWGFAKLEVDQGVYLVHCDGSKEEHVRSLRKFVQHTGCGISSRQAEDLLLQHSLRSESFQEAGFAGNAETKAEADLAGLIGCRTSDVLICSSGMNAFYAGFRAVQEFNRSRGRRAWLQLGWLYLDSGRVLDQFLDEGETLECLYDVSALDYILARIRALGDSLAAVVVECPSNPLLRVCDLKEISSEVRRQGGVMIIDPTVASVYNVDVLPYADLLVTSLTKYASIEGDIMIGALAVNPKSRFYGDLILRTSAYHVPPYRRDVARLCVEMDQAREIVPRLNQNAAELFRYLKNHAGVSRAFSPACPSEIETISKEGRSAGSVITIELSGDLEKFYDCVRLMKGPSFGTRFTLLCPFMYLAHYDLVTSQSGREFLHRIGICPELIRISVGEEPYEQIEAIFEEALQASIT